MSDTTYKGPSKTYLLINAILFAIAITIMWIVYLQADKASHGSTYPWPAWFTSGWGLFLLGHFCNVYFDSNKNHQDKNYEKYLYERDH